VEAQGDRITAFVEKPAAKEGRTFTQVLGNVDRAFEMTVLDTEWAFWQYFKKADCPSVPGKNASTQTIYNFIDNVTDWNFYTDQGVLPFAPYYYQASTQLGWPAPKFDYLRGLTRYSTSAFYALKLTVLCNRRSQMKRNT